MVLHRYTAHQLRRLRNSPLVEKPEALPSIEQWVELVPNKPRTQSSFGRDGDEALKRPLFEARHSSRQIKASDEIFLGPPKTSFGSALSARRSSESAEKAAGGGTDATKNKTDRFGGRDRNRREKEYEPPPRRDRDTDQDRTREKTEQSNGFDSRSKFRTLKPYEGDEEGYAKARDRNLESRENDRNGERQDESGTDLTSRRPNHGRGRFEQPWFRGDNHDESNGRIKPERGWREPASGQGKDWQRNDRQEQDPEWMNDSGPGDRGSSHTQEDFQKWKDKMRAGMAGNEEKSDAGPLSPPINSPATATQDQTGGNFFGLWGEKKEEKSIDAALPSTKTPSKPKSSRFAGFFAPQAGTEAVPEPQSPVKTTTTNADKEGFQKILAMLGSTNMGTPSQQGHAEFATDHTGNGQSRQFRSPDPTPLDRDIGSPDRNVNPQAPPERFWENVHPDRTAMHRHHQLETQHEPSYQPNDHHKHMATQEQNRPPPSTPQDKAFFLSMMQQHQRQPFNEAQIYGQSFRHDSPNDISSVLNDMSSKSQSSKPRMPPGFYNNEPVFPQNPNMDPRFHMDHPQMHHPDAMPDRFDPSRPPPRDDFDPMHRPMPPPQHQGPGGPGPGFWPTNRPPSQSQQDLMSQPPGINRPPMGPNYGPQFPSNQAGQPQNNQQQPPPRSGPGPGQFGPGFGSGPPPGMPPQMPPPPGFGVPQGPPPPQGFARRPPPGMPPQQQMQQQQQQQFETYGQGQGQRREGPPGLYGGYMK